MARGPGCPITIGRTVCIRDDTLVGFWLAMLFSMTWLKFKGLLKRDMRKDVITAMYQ